MPHPTDVHVGRRVRAARMAKGMSQTGLGKALGLSFQQIQKYENGSNRIGSSRLWDISNLLDTPIDFFFEGLEENKMQVSGKAEAPMSRRTIQLAKAINSLPNEEAKTNFLRLIEAFSKAS